MSGNQRSLVSAWHDGYVVIIEHIHHAPCFIPKHNWFRYKCKMCNFISVLLELNLNCRRFFLKNSSKASHSPLSCFRASVDSVSVFSRQDNILKNVRW